jgi:hypothetical protein
MFLLLSILADRQAGYRVDVSAVVNTEPEWPNAISFPDL